MFVCPLCLKRFNTVEELNLHFQQNDECRGYAKKIMFSRSLVTELSVESRIKSFLNEYSGKPLKIRFAK